MFRYWDGQSWSETLTSDPAAPPPGGAPQPPPTAPTQVSPAQQYPQQPQQPQQYDPYQQQGQQPGQQPGQQQYAAQPQPGQYGGGGYPGQPPYPGAPGGGSGGGSGKKIGLIALAVLLVVALGVGAFFLVSAASDDDSDDKATDDSSQSDEPTDETESPSDETESPSESPSDETESPSESPTQSDFPPNVCTGGLPNAGGEVSGDQSISGGDLTLPPVRGYNPLERQITSTFAFEDGVAAVGKPIEQQWIALYAVGGLPKANGFADLEASADQVIDCMTGSPNFYRGFSGREDLERESIEVDGHDAYSITAEIRIDDPEVNVDGDHAQVIVVDTGDDEHLGLYVSVVPIGNQKLISQQDAATGQLQVDD
jgi:hypothetical protein